MSLSELTEKRRKHVQSCRDNNDHSHKMVADLYSDPFHFIYELLQNADDAEALEVIFDLTDESLKVTHDGKKLFNYEDVDSITTIGASTKKDDINSIGTFGAGFKSVFSITETPTIHSGEHHFKIVDLIVPEEVKPLDVEEQPTVVYLPFNHPDMPPDDAYKNISDRLINLAAESLLFLRNIKKISWDIGSNKGYYSFITQGDRISLISQHNEKDSRREYLLFKKVIEIDHVELNIVVAYQIDGQTFVSAPYSRLFVFFPTEVITGLNFLVHASYKTTPNRETIPFDDNQNQTITGHLSMLIAESIQSIKNSGLLDVNFLTLLPVDAENTHPLYRAAFEKVRCELATKALLPTSDGGYVSAGKALLARGKDLTTLLRPADCLQLFAKEAWLSTEITADKTRDLRDYLIKTLNIPEIDMEKFCIEITENFMATKPDEWVIKFYANVTENIALYRAGDHRKKKGVLRERPIIRLEDDMHICPEDNLGELQVYLPPEEGESEFKTVKKSLVADEKSIEFLKELGLKEPNKIDEIKEFIVPKYGKKYRGCDIAHDEYKKHFRKVLTIWEGCSKEYEKEKITNLLKPLQFIRCINQSKSISYQKSADVYFRKNNLLSWYEGNQDDDIYFLEVGFNTTENDEKFIASLGVRDKLKMSGTNNVEIDFHGRHEMSVNGFNPDFNIHGLEHALQNITIKNSKLLWSILLKHTNKLKGYVEKFTDASMSYEKGEEKASTAMQTLDGISWLYSAEGKLLDPPIDKIEVKDLSDIYQKEHDNIDKLVKALGLKLDIVAKFEEENPGMKVIPQEKHDKFQKFLEQESRSDDASKDTEEPWIPETDSSDTVITKDESGYKEHISEDLSDQDTSEAQNNAETDDADDDYDDAEQRKSEGYSNNPKNSKKIGDWGENVAKRYLVDRYPRDEIVSLNENGNIGKGYDFVVKRNGEEIAYFEVKSRTGEMPQRFQISGTQWNWAKNLHGSGRGDMYTILLVANAGKKDVSIKAINNPVALWKVGKLYADPVDIRL